MSQNETSAFEERSKLEIRHFDKSKLADYRNNPNYEYDAYKEVEKGAFQRFVERIQNWFYSTIRSGTTRQLLRYGFYLLCFVALTFFVIKLFGIETNTMFKGGSKSSLAFEVTEESLDEINFEEEIAKAEQNGQLRLAVRLIYLQALKTLADRDFITVKKGKTNHDYLYEIGDTELRENFSSLSFIFDYTWYGHFDANAELLNRMKSYSGAIATTVKAA